MPYDDMEAKDRLAKHAEKVDPDDAGRAKAAEDLLDALVKLNGTAGFKIQRVQGINGTVLMSLLHRTLSIHVTAQGGKLVVHHLEGFVQRREVKLDFDRLTGELVGVEPDTFYGPPAPGQPKRRRSALAVVVEAALQAMRD